MTDPVGNSPTSQESVDFECLQTLWQDGQQDPLPDLDLEALIKKQKKIWWRMRFLTVLECTAALIAALVVLPIFSWPQPGPIVAAWTILVLILGSLTAVFSRWGSWQRSDGSLRSVLETERRHHISAIRYFKWSFWLNLVSMPLLLMLIWIAVQREGGLTQKSLLVTGLIGASVILVVPLLRIFWRKAQERQKLLETVNRTIQAQGPDHPAQDRQDGPLG